jgi:hypothetical protein
MSFQAALTAIGSSQDYSSHAPSAPVWLVHVYGMFASGKVPPPTQATADLGTTTTSTTSVTSTTPPPPSYFEIIDAVTGAVIVQNY